MLGQRIGRLYRSRDTAGLAEIMRSASTPRRMSAAAALSEIGTPEAEAALLEALSDSSAFVVKTAIGGLTRIDPDRDPAPILRAMRGGDDADREPTPQEVMEAGLVQLRALDTVPILIGGLSSDDHTTRMMSAQALAELADRRAVPALTEAQSDPHRGVRDAANKALGAMRVSGDA